MIIEMCMLWLVSDCIISSYNHRAHDDYSKSAEFPNGYPAFCQMVHKEMINAMVENWIAKGMKDAKRLAEHV